jgi:hypothetical protein
MARARSAILRQASAVATLGVFMAVGVLPTPGQTAAPTAIAAAPDRTTYLQRAEVEMDGWRLKLHGMEDKAEATGQVAATAAEADLRTAWNRAEADARNLRTATAAGWEEAKSSFEQTSRDLQRAWDRSRL